MGLEDGYGQQLGGHRATPHPVPAAGDGRRTGARGQHLRRQVVAQLAPAVDPIPSPVRHLSEIGMDRRILERFLGPKA